MENTQFNSQNSKLYKQTTEFQDKYKTEMCRGWGQGFCEFGEKCIFAHGYKELRNAHSLTNYKTKKCKQFHEKGYCQYGNRCQFLHKSANEKKSTPEKQEKKRLPVFSSLAPQES